MSRIVYAAALVLSAAILVSSAPPANAETYSILWNFKNAQLGEPLGRISVQGSLYGTCSGYQNGSQVGNGQGFELTKSNGSGNSISILKFDGTDGAIPNAGLAQDASGSLEKN